ncbi:hypothetical protein JRQ81_002169 [Phrynocephalus forsythii]|uniref:Uncharacterized protein n=1 Tax=Phrynocephalus forsythii TaxID=171643 RepID=A0A9Q1AVR6_9SAUR|nr:hypothetical protein JRQ81_002169 [Phrynocephalus forsythii]
MLPRVPAKTSVPSNRRVGWIGIFHSPSFSTKIEENIKDLRFFLRFSPPFWMAQRPIFKKCSRCGGKVPLTDGHSLCLYCLGDTHSTTSCAHCQRFTTQALRNRRHRLNTFLLERSLKPQDMSSESQRHASTEISKASKPPKKVKKSSSVDAPAPKKPRTDKRPPSSPQRSQPSNLTLSPNR